MFFHSATLVLLKCQQEKWEIARIHNNFAVIITQWEQQIWTNFKLNETMKHGNNDHCSQQISKNSEFRRELYNNRRKFRRIWLLKILGVTKNKVNKKIQQFQIREKSCFEYYATSVNTYRNISSHITVLIHLEGIYLHFIQIRKKMDKFSE